MRKIIPLSLIAASALFAGSINISTGWNLVGSMEDLSPSSVNCAKTVWAYDANTTQWKLYTNSTYGFGSPSSYGYSEISNLTKGEGYWINSACETTIEYSDTSTSSTYFDIFDFTWQDVKKDARYTVQGNALTASATSVSLSSSKSDNAVSRTEMATTLSSLVPTAKATVKITDTSTGYNKLQFRTHSDITIDDTIKTATGLNSNNVVAMASIFITGKIMFAKVTLDDGTTEVDVYNSKDTAVDAMYYNDAASDFIGKDINLTIAVDTLLDTITFSATAPDLTIGTVTFTRPTTTQGGEIKTIKLRTQIDDESANTDGEEAGASITAEVSNVTTQDTTSAVEIVSTTTTTLSLATLTNAVTYEEDDSQWYGTFAKSGDTLTVVDYEYDDGTWIVEETSTGVMDVNSSDNTLASISFADDGFAGNFKVNSTKQITSINGTTYTDLFISDTTMTVTASGTGWTDTWGWEPYDYSTNPETLITTTQAFLAESLTSNNWFGDDDYYPMLKGTTTGTIGDTGDVVQGEFTGYCDNTGDGVNDLDCKMVSRTTTVIGTWELTSTGIEVDTPNELNIISIISDSNETDSGYDIQSIGIDKVGSVWNEKMLTGSEATSDVVKELLGN